DIPILTKYFIEKYNEKFNKNVKGVSDEVLSIFYNHEWDGNVRELENLIEGIISISDVEIIEVEDLPYKFRQRRSKPFELSLKEILEDTERTLIKEALKRTDNNTTQAAELLKIPSQTLQYRLQKLKI